MFFRRSRTSAVATVPAELSSGTVVHGREAAHELVAQVPIEAAWSYWTNVEHWAITETARVELIDLEFDVGSRGRVLVDGGHVVEWTVTEAAAPYRGAYRSANTPWPVTYTWCFDPVDEERTRITQRVLVDGEESTASAIAQGIAHDLGTGMETLVNRMVAAHGG
jgi:hypothetical protein